MRCKLDWAELRAAEADASSARARSTTYDLAELVRYIDWTPFFQTWELKGSYPAHPRRRQVSARPRARSSTTRRPC